jgi:hypothetical protein
MRATDVFTPNKEPSVTYIEDHLVQEAKHLRESLQTGAGLVSISGPSKSGKTVFIEKNIGRDRLIMVKGAGATTPEVLWNRVFTIIGTPLKVTMERGRKEGSSTAVEVGAGVPIVLSGKSSLGFSEESVKAEKAEHARDALQLLIRDLAGSGLVVFVDDFHYVPRDVQADVAAQIKVAVDEGVLFVCASVQYHSDDVLRANADLRGRIVGIDFDYWTRDELLKIANKGFAALNAKVTDAMVAAFADEAAGSPQLMQALCLNCCYEAGLSERSAGGTTIPPDRELIRRVCVRTASTADYSSTVEKMKEGPKVRGRARSSHVLKDGGKVLDVYPLILRGIASDPPTLTIRYGQLQARIAALCAQDPPSGSSVTGACSHMSEIANDAETRTVVEWDGSNDVLDIRDPYLLFFLRWGDWQ